MVSYLKKYLSNNCRDNGSGSGNENGKKAIDHFSFPMEVPGELDPLSFHKLCVDMHVNKMKFERKSSLEYSGAPNGSVPQNICSSDNLLLAGRIGKY